MSETDALVFLTEMETTAFFQPGQWIQLGIADPHTDALLGDIGLHLSSNSQTGEVGFTLAPSAQGRGIATNAVREAIQLFFTATPASQILGITDARNTPSIRLLNRLNFKHTETRPAIFRDEQCTEQVFILSRCDSQKLS